MTKPGYAEGGYGRMRPFGPSRPLQLADHERVGDVTVRVFKYAVIAGHVTDEAGEPVVAATLRLYRRQLVAGRRVLQPMVTTQTDDRGAYRFANQLQGDLRRRLADDDVVRAVELRERRARSELSDHGEYAGQQHRNRNYRRPSAHA